MRLLFAVALALAAFLAVADVSALNDAPSKRLLRATVSVDEEEERGMLDSLSNKVTKLFVNPGAIAIKTMDDPKIAKVLRTSLLKKFKSVDPKKFNSVDDLFNSKAFKGLENYVVRLNNQDIDKQTSVAKVFSTGLGDEQAFHVFFTAARSSDKTVKRSGKYFQDQLLTQWATEGKAWTAVAENFPKGLSAKYYSYFEQKYSRILMNLIHDSQAKSTQLAKAAAKAKTAANAAA